MNGIYREYDRQGHQTAEIPVVDGIPIGRGWVIENNVHAYKKFEKWYDNTSRVISN